jgi:hypothetical protein
MHRNCVALCLSLLSCCAPALSRTRGNPSPIAPDPSGRIRRHSKVYIAPMGGFETVLFAALDKQIVPLVIVEKPDQAEFEVKETGAERVTWARLIFASQPVVAQQPEIFVTSLRTGQAVLACPLSSLNSVHARQNAAEDCAKRLKRKVLEK